MDSLAVAVAVFLGSAVFVVLAGIALARFGDDIAEKTGWGTLWVGTILVPVATSLPELITNFTSVFIDAPDMAIGNIFGANMVNVFLICLVAILFGVHNLFGGQPRNTRYLILVAIAVCSIAVFFGWVGSISLGPSSIGGLLVVAAYLVGMRVVYNAGRRQKAPEGGAVDDGRASPRGAFIGFGIASLVIVIAAPLLANAADSIGEITGLGGSFMGVLVVSLVTTLPETSVTVAAVSRKSYGIAMGNVYGSCAFNITILSFTDLAHTEGPLLSEMLPEHFVAGVGAIVLMTAGFLIVRSFYDRWLVWARMLVFAVPVVYVGVVYWVYALSVGNGV